MSLTNINVFRIGILGFALAGPPVARAAVKLDAFVQNLLKQTAVNQQIQLEGTRYFLHRISVQDPQSSRVGLEVIWVEFPQADFQPDVVTVRRFGDPGKTLAASKDSNTIAIINGGYFGTDDGRAFYPLGLIISNGARTSKIWPWRSGGFLSVNRDGTVNITEVTTFVLSPNIKEAVQSKPLLVNNGHRSIRSNDHQLSNRTAFGLGKDGSLVLVGAFSSTNSAVSLYEFSEILATDKQRGGAGLDMVLNLDGGPGAHLSIPQLKLDFGVVTETYIPNCIRVRRKI